MASVPSYPLQDEDLCVQAILILGECLANLLDETGNTYTVPMRAEYRDDGLSQIPEVVVACELGDDVMGIGFGSADYDSNGYPIYLSRHPQSIITIKVRGRSDAERRYIVGTLRSALRFGYISAAPGQAGVYEAAMRNQLATAGVFIDRVYKPTYPKADLAAPRQDGQVYEANIRIDATVEVSVVADVSTVVIPHQITFGGTVQTPLIDNNGNPIEMPDITFVETG